MTAQEHDVCLLLGSNIQPEANLALAVDLLGQKVKIVQFSSIWETSPAGSMGPNFLNLAMLITTSLEAAELKVKLIRPLEAQLGRVRRADKNAPRPIDIDIILFDGRLMDPNLWLFAYRAVPVAEILPDYRSGQGDTLKQIASQLAQKTLIRLRTDVLINPHLQAT